MKDELVLLQQKYNHFAQRISPWGGEYSFLTTPSDNGSPHAEFVDGIFHYIVTERGLELERRSTAEISEILYWMLYDLTFWMGVAFELKNRVAGRDCRRIMFDHWLGLMKKADPAMAVRHEGDIAAILTENPFDDRLSPTND